MSCSQYVHPSDQIVEFMQRIYDHGMTTTSGGNLSIMDENGDMWISPGGIDKGSLRREDIVCVRADGTIEGIHKPSSEYPFHRAMYRIRPEIKAIVHAHPPALVSFSIAGKVPDTAVLAEAARICGEPGFAPYEVPGSEALGRNIAEVFRRGHRAVLLENHGVVVGGASLPETFACFEMLDFTARALYQATLLGGVSVPDRSGLNADPVAEPMTPFDPPAPSSAEKDLRLKLSGLVRRAYEQQLFTAAAGDFAVRLDGDRFLITPEDGDRGKLEPGDLVLVDQNRYARNRRPGRQTGLARLLFQAQPELNALTFSYPPYLTAYGLAGEPFDPRVIPESYILLRELPAFDCGAQFREPERLCGTLSPRHPVVRIAHDAVITAGKTALEAFDRLEVAEYSAKAAIAARPFGGLRPITPAQVADLVASFKLLP